MEKKKKKTTAKDSRPPLLSVRGLSEASGVPSKKIRAYIEAGLLPEPAKKRGKTPYYDKSCIPLICLIDMFHSKYGLPVKIIKQVLEDMGHEKVITEGRDLEKKLNRARELPWFERDFGIDNEPLLTKKALVLASGLSLKELEDAIGQKMIMPGENGLFSKNDLEIALMLSRLKKTDAKTGTILLDFLTMQLHTIESLVEKEFDTFFQNVINKNITVDDAKAMAENSFDVVRSLLPACYKQLLGRKVAELSKKAAGTQRKS